MDSTTNSPLQVQLRERVQRLDPCNGFAKSLRIAIPAMDTRDPAQVEWVNEAVERAHGWPGHMRVVLREILDLIQNKPSEEWDELGSEIGARFDAAVRLLEELRDGAVKGCHEHGFQIKNGVRLDSDIHELQMLKKQGLENWPWSNQELPPTDRDMVKASMAALARGETGESIDDLIGASRVNGNRSCSGEHECATLS